MGISTMSAVWAFQPGGRTVASAIGAFVAPFTELKLLIGMDAVEPPATSKFTAPDESHEDGGADGWAVVPSEVVPILS